jgi:hypothetical protein
VLRGIHLTGVAQLRGLALDRPDPDQSNPRSARMASISPGCSAYVNSPDRAYPHSEPRTWCHSTAGVELKSDAIKDVKPVRRRRDPRPATRAAAFIHPPVELAVASLGRQEQQQGERSKLAALAHDALEAPVARESHFEVLGPLEPARGLVGNPDVVPFRHPMDHPFDLDLLAHCGAVRGSSQTTCALAGLHRLLWRRSVNPDVKDVVPQLREPLFVAVERFDYGEQLFLRRARITVEDLIDLLCVLWAVVLTEYRSRSPDPARAAHFDLDADLGGRREDAGRHQGLAPEVTFILPSAYVPVTFETSFADPFRTGHQRSPEGRAATPTCG